MNHNKWSTTSKKAITLSLAFTLAAFPAMSAISAGSALAEPSMATSLSVDHAEANTPIQYQIHARLDEKKMHIQGEETVTYRNTSNDTVNDLVFHTFADANRSKSTQSSLFKRTNEKIQEDNPKLKPEIFLGGIDIQKVTNNGQALSFTNEKQALTVQLKQGIKPGESVTVQVKFEVKLPYGSQRLSYFKDMINGAHWFPVMSVYDESKHQWNKTPYSETFETDYYASSDYEVHINVPDAYQISMPGTVTIQADAEDGRKIVSTVANNTREFVFFASPNFKIHSVTRDGLTVEYYYLDNMPGKEKIVDQYVDQAFKVIQFFNAKYGKYPYPEFRIVESYVEGVAVEFSRLIQMGQIRVNAEPAEDTTFIHEIAHQWFHAIIGNNSEKESFLDEGFADFSMMYYVEKQGNAANGFKSIQVDESSFETAIASTNDEVGDNANPVFYGKGRQAIYQLYRSVGEEKFDAFMKEYFERYKFKNASIKGLLETIEDVLGKETRDMMDKALFRPNFVLNPEYRLSEEEKTAYFREQFKELYHSSLAQIPDLPFETMSRIMDKALQGEPLAIVVSDPVSKEVDKQQRIIVEQLTNILQFSGIKPEIITERQMLKKKMKQDLAHSNLIVIGNAKSNGLIQALKPGMIQRSKNTGFPWKSMMNKKNAAGAYVVKHPHNQNRLLLHFFWNGESLNNDFIQAFTAQALSATNFTANFYQYYVMDKTGTIVSDKKVVNPISSLFGEE